MRSDRIKKGVEAAPQRALLYALGLTDYEMEKPLIGIVSSQNEIVPGHMNLDKIVAAVKQGVSEAGGVPVAFPAIAVCDGIAMGHEGMKYSLVTRELIADSTEAMAMAHPFDGLVMVPNCDKNVPGLLMAAARLNIPSIFVSGGPMLAGISKKERISYSTVSEAVSSFKANRIDGETLCTYEKKACPTCGSCSGMFTANSMNCLTEVLGMALPGNGTIPAVYSARLRLAKETGRRILELVKEDVKPRDLMVREAFENALTIDMALGCSTNSMLHLPAIAHECEIEIDLDLANEISKKTPNLFLIVKKYVLIMLVVIALIPPVMRWRTPEFTGVFGFILSVIFGVFMLLQYVSLKEYQFPKATTLLCATPFSRKAIVSSKYIFCMAIYAIC